MSETKRNEDMHVQLNTSLRFRSKMLLEILHFLRVQQIFVTLKVFVSIVF